MKNEKAHIDKGIRKILEKPKIFNFFNNHIIGAKSYMDNYCENHFNHLGKVDFLDIGCGTCEILESLNTEIDYYGFDMQLEYIEIARTKFSHRGQFYHEAVGQNYNTQWQSFFDVINIHGLIHHLSDEDSDILLQAAQKYLKKTGFVITVDTVKHEGQSYASKWLTSKDRGQNIRTPEEYLGLAEKYFNVEESYITTDHLNIPYSIFTMKLFQKK